MNRPSVVHISSCHRSDDTRIFEKEVLSLCKSGYQVELIAAKSGMDKASLPQGVELNEFRPHGRIYRFTILQIVLLFKLMRSKAEIVHFHDPDLIIIGWLLSFSKRKMIYDVHENYQKSIISREYLPKQIRGIIANSFARIEKLLAKRFDAIILADDQLASGFDEEKYTTVKNYPHDLSNLDIPSRKSNKPPSEIPKAVYIGSITKARGAIVMADLVAELAKVHGIEIELDLIGAMSPDLESELRSHSAFERMKLHGHLHYDLARSYLAKADFSFCLLLPTPAYIEAVPVKLLEYLGVGLPVIASDFPRIRELEELHPGCLLVEPTNITSAALALSDEIRTGKIFERRNLCKDVVKDKYSWQNEEAKLLKLYQNLYS